MVALLISNLKGIGVLNVILSTISQKESFTTGNRGQTSLEVGIGMFLVAGKVKRPECF